MASVLNRLTGEYVRNAHIPDYVPDPKHNETPWIINPDVSQLEGLDPIFWVINPDNTVREMTPDEKNVAPAVVEQAKQARLDAVNAACADGIIGGLVSNALGYPRIYDTAMEDQINAIGAIIAIAPNPYQPQGGSIPYACRDPNTGKKEFIVHTYAQLGRVLLDGAAKKLQQLQHANELKAKIKAAHTLTDLKFLVWP